MLLFFFFQAEDGIRDKLVTGVQTCALPIFFNAIWWVPDSQTQACRALRGIGACWAVVTEKHRFILFGTYPFEEQWRPALAILIFIGLFVASAMRRFWRKELILIWLGALTAIGILMWGGVLGLSFVPQERWGGVAVT